MASTYTYTKSQFTSLGGAEVDANVLRSTIGEDLIIIESLIDQPNDCRWINELPDPTYQFAFVNALTAPMEAQLDVVVANHTGSAPTNVVIEVFSRPGEPQVTDDDNSGFSLGSIWRDNTTNQLYLCVDATNGAAVWEWISFAGAFRPNDVTPVTTAIDPDPQPGNRVLVTQASGGADLVDSEDIELDVTVANYTPTGAGNTIEEHLLGIDAGLGAPLANHVSTHQDGGADELNVAGLSGVLADPQTPATHASTHSDGGTDEIIAENLATGSTDVNDVLAPNGSGGLQTLNRVYGTEYNEAENLAVQTTTSTTFQNALRMPTAGDIALVGGTYMIEISYGWNHDETGNDFEARVMENDVQMGEIHKQEPKDVGGTFGTTGTSQRHYVTRKFRRVLGAGNYHFDFEYRTDSGGVESSVWDVVMTIVRVA